MQTQTQTQAQRRLFVCLLVLCTCTHFDVLVTIFHRFMARIKRYMIQLIRGGMDPPRGAAPPVWTHLIDHVNWPESENNGTQDVL
jgi:hypothetical protein